MIITNWNLIKFTMRNNYIIEDAGICIDYLDLLSIYNKDLRRPKYILPKD